MGGKSALSDRLHSDSIKSILPPRNTLYLSSHVNKIHSILYVMYDITDVVFGISQLIITWYGMGDAHYIPSEVKMKNSSFINHLLY